MDKKNLSPLPKKQANLNLLTFPQALNKVIDGKTITRVEWEDKEEYGLLRNSFLEIHTKGKFHQWIVSEGDLIAIDWYVLGEN